jgi:hypothetical protein
MQVAEGEQLHISNLLAAGPPFPFIAVRYCRRRMPPVFWIGLGIAAFIFLVGVIAGARSRTATLLSGAAIGLYLGVMCAFPLLAIGLATS